MFIHLYNGFLSPFYALFMLNSTCLPKPDLGQGGVGQGVLTTGFQL